jgi:lipocalin
MRARSFRGLLAASFLALLAGCAGAPAGVEPVRGFAVERYLGQWYEIARLDHRFERGLEQVVDRLVAKAKSLDFETSELIFVRQCTTGTSGAACQAAAR